MAVIATVTAMRHVNLLVSLATGRRLVHLSPLQAAKAGRLRQKNSSQRKYGQAPNGLMFHGSLPKVPRSPLESIRPRGDAAAMTARGQNREKFGSAQGEKLAANAQSARSFLARTYAKPVELDESVPPA